MSETDERIAELQRQIDELKAERAKREPKGTDLSNWGGGGRSNKLVDQLAIPPDALAAMLAATPPDLMADLRADARRVTVKSFEPIEPKVKGRGWQDEKPITQPPGVALADRITERFAGPPHGPKPEPTVAGESKPKEER